MGVAAESVPQGREYSLLGATEISTYVLTLLAVHVFHIHLLE